MKDWERKIIMHISDARKNQRLYLWIDRSASYKGKRYEENNLKSTPREILKLLVYKLWKNWNYCQKCNHTLLDNTKNNWCLYSPPIDDIDTIQAFDLEIHGD